MDPIPSFLPSLFPRLIRPLPLAGSVARAGDSLSTAAPSAEAKADMAHGCGWFNSSHELHAGLLITEHDSPDPVANDLPLDVWLAWHVAGPSAPGQAACA